MKWVRHLLVACVSSWWFIATVAGQRVKGFSSTPPKYSVEEVDRLLVELDSVLNLHHPAAFDSITGPGLRQVMQLLRGNVRQRRDSLTLDETVDLVRRVRYYLGDGHFTFYYWPEAWSSKKYKKYDFELYASLDSTDRVVLVHQVMCADSTIAPPGAEILTLDGHKVDSLVPKITLIHGLDDHNYSAPNRVYNLVQLPILYQAIHGWRDSLAITYRSGDEVKACPLRNDYKDEVRAGSDPRKPKGRKKRLKYNMHLDSTSLPYAKVLHLRSFDYPDVGYSRAIKELSKLMQRVRELNTRALIIDLRENTGGLEGIAIDVFRYFAEEEFFLFDDARAFSKSAMGNTVMQRIAVRMLGGAPTEVDGVYYSKYVKYPIPPHEQNHFYGEVVVLIGEQTFSSGAILAYLFQHYNIGILIGQGSGASVQRVFAGTAEEVDLGPEGEFHFSVPVWKMDIIGDAKGVLKPDIPVARDNTQSKTREDHVKKLAEQLLSQQPPVPATPPDSLQPE